MWLECLLITSGVAGKFFGSGEQFARAVKFHAISGDHFESDDEDLEKIREEQVFALFYEAWVPLINRPELSPTRTYISMRQLNQFLPSKV
jgi:hypothetical protein